MLDSLPNEKKCSRSFPKVYSEAFKVLKVFPRSGQRKRIEGSTATLVNTQRR